MSPRFFRPPTTFHGKAMKQSVVRTCNVITDAAGAGLFALALCSGVLSAAAVAEVRNPNGVAVIIGNVDYEHRDVPDVAYAGRDADGFRRYVVDVLGFDPENVIHVTDVTRRLHDVHGNVTEWVEDCWNNNSRGALTDGSAWKSGNCGRRVLRGGSWVSGPRDLRSAVRYGGAPGNRDGVAGFRVARTLTP